MTKAALKREMQRILALPAGTVLDGTDRDLVETVISTHPNLAEKTGPGIDRFVIRNHALHIIRTDGSEDNISYRRALAPRTNATARAETHAALRQEIAGEIAAFKRDRRKRGDNCCAISGVTLNNDAAVDHAPPWTFALLANAWLYGRPPPLLEAVDPHGRRLADRGLADDWRRFHHFSARLRLVHKDIHNAITATQQRHKA